MLISCLALSLELAAPSLLSPCACSLWPVKALGLLRSCASRGERTRRVCLKFLLRALNPGCEFLIVHHAHCDRHEGVVLAAQFRALAVEHAELGSLEPGF